MFTQLNPAIPLHVIGKGDGYAIGLIDYGQEHNLIWVTALNANGEIWCASNPDVRLGKNWTMGRHENPIIANTKAPRPLPQGVAVGETAAVCDGYVAERV